VIKTAIILVLLVILCGGAFLSRPSKQAFETYVREQAKSADSMFARMAAQWQVDGYLESIQFKDRYLFVTVEREGRTEYVGAFSNFFAIGGGEKPAEPKSDATGLPDPSAKTVVAQPKTEKTRAEPFPSD
jgi:hypothetical protein